MEVFAGRRAGAADAAGHVASDSPAPAPGRSGPRSAASALRGLLNPRALRVAVAFALSSYAVFLMNASLFPLFDATFTYARDVSIVFEACVLAVLVALSAWRPGAVPVRGLDAAACVLSVAGTAATAAGIVVGNAPLLTVGACAAILARAWASLDVMLAAVRLPSGSVAVALLAGSLVANAARAIPVPSEAGVLLVLAVLPLASIALVGGESRALLADAHESRAIAEVSVTRPASFLPLTHVLYVFQFLMFVGFGFALRFGGVGGSPAFGALLLTAAMLALLVITVARGGDMPLDGLCATSTLLLVAGFMTVIAGLSNGPYLANSLLVVGNALYGMLVNVTLVALSARNRSAALPILSWATVISALGTTLGAQLGKFGNSWVDAGQHDAVALLVGGACLAVVGYQLFAMHGFSFRATIDGVERLDQARPAAWDAVQDEAGAGSSAPGSVASAAELISARCSVLAERYGLTPREREVFEMLARGRDREYIEIELVISRNTVKAHVKHIYAKLEIHGHQELLDLVEGADAQLVDGMRRGRAVGGP